MTKSKNKKTDNQERIYQSNESSFRLYLREISRIPLLTKEDEEKTAKMAAQGNKAAREKLVNSNLRFVVMIAKKYQGQGLPLQDLVSEGNIGLINAAEHFNVEKGYRFITYAVWWIRQAIVKAIQEKGRMIRLPCNKTNELTLIEKSRQIIQNEPNQKSEAGIRETAAFLDMSPEKIEDLIQMNQEVLSLDEPLSTSGSSSTLKDSIEDEYIVSPVEHALNTILKEEVATILTKLESRAAEVLRSRFGLGDAGTLTLKEVGDRYQLSRERVRQIEKRALGQLKDSSDCGKLKGYIA